MKKQFKRWLSVVTACAMLCGAVVAAVPVAAAEISDETVGASWNRYEIPGVGALKYVSYTNGTATIVAFVPFANQVDLKIPREIYGYKVTKINKYAFGNDYSPNYKLRSVVIPNTVKYIGEMAFSYCKNLTRVTMENGNNIGLKQLGSGIFAQCDNLKEVTLSSDVNTIPGTMFQDCKNLKKLTLYGNINKIGENAFWNVGKGLVIEGYKGTAAEIYAKQHGNPFRELLFGDVNADNRIDIQDYYFLRAILSETIPFSSSAYVLADTNGDSVVDVRDLTYLMRRYHLE